MPTLKELRAKAKDLGLSGFSRLSKDELTHQINMTMVEAGAMPNMAHVRAMARDLGLTGYGKLKKADLIREVQVAEGHAACYQQISDCGQMDCLFRPDCMG